MNFTRVLKPAAMRNGNLFREYIGAQFSGVTFPKVPISPSVTFDFILSFAVDVDKQNPLKATNGVFSPYWDTRSFTPAAVTQIKSAHRNARVMLSIGGDSVLGDSNKVSFTPKAADHDSWVNNAFTSLKGLIDQYGLDGVDIDYERFAAGIDARTFSRCVGRLFALLKQHYSPTKMVTSIAPFSDPNIPIQAFYQQLWTDHHDVIDYVNFQFYAGKTPDVATYVNKYNQQIANYPGATVLASFITGTGNGNGQVTPDVALKAAKQLRSDNKLPGIFIWSADSSFNDKQNGFAYESKAQQILSGNDDHA